jgi:hypothetical protein
VRGWQQSDSDAPKMPCVLKGTNGYTAAAATTTTTTTTTTTNFHAYVTSLYY